MRLSPVTKINGSLVIHAPERKYMFASVFYEMQLKYTIISVLINTLNTFTQHDFFYRIVDVTS
jgi:hypothetical protein